LLIFPGRVFERHDAGAARFDIGCGHDEGIAIAAVEPLGDITSQLDVLPLVFTDWHQIGVVHDDVGDLEHWIVEKGGRYRLLGASSLVLELRHTAQLAIGRDGVQQPAELRVFPHVSLDEEDRCGRIDSRGQ